MGHALAPAQHVLVLPVASPEDFTQALSNNTNQAQPACSLHIAATGNSATYGQKSAGDVTALAIDKFGYGLDVLCNELTLAGLQDAQS